MFVWLIASDAPAIHQLRYGVMQVVSQALLLSFLWRQAF